MIWGHSSPRLRGANPYAGDFISTEGDPSPGRPSKSPALWLAAFLDRLALPSGSATTPNSLSSLLASSPQLDLKSALSKMGPDYRQRMSQHLGEQGQEELLSLAKSLKSDPVFFESLLLLAHRLQQSENRQASALLLKKIQGELGRTVSPNAFTEEFNKLARRADQDLQVLLGKGAFAERWELLSQAFLKEVADPWALLGFGVAGTVYQGTRLATLSRLFRASPGVLTRGVTSKLTASGLAFLAETPAMVLTVKGGRALSGVAQDLNPQLLQQELLGTGLTLFFLKAAGPLGRVASSKGSGVFPELVKPSAMLGGIYLAQLSERALGWRPPAADGTEALLGVLLTFAQFQVAGHLGNRLFGRTFGSWQRSLDFYSQELPKQRTNYFDWPPGLNHGVAEMPGKGLLPALEKPQELPTKIGIIAMAGKPNGSGKGTSSLPSKLGLRPGFLSFGEQEIRKAYEGIEAVGKSHPPPELVAIQFEARSDWATALTILKNLQTPMQIPSETNFEEFMKIYFQVISAPVYRYPNRSLAEQASLSGLLSAVLPAYLLYHREKPEQAYQELKAIHPSGSIKKREGWRGIAFLTLRLLEGMPADLGLVREAEAFFGDSPIGRRFKKVAELLQVPNGISNLGLEAWRQSRDALDQVGLGIYAFMRQPGNTQAARALPERLVPHDREKIALRVSAWLDQAYRFDEIGEAAQNPYSTGEVLAPSSEGIDSADSRVESDFLRASYHAVQRELPDVLNTLIEIYREAFSEPLIGFSPRFKTKLEQIRAKLQIVQHEWGKLREAKVDFLGGGEDFALALQLLLPLPDYLQQEFREKGLTPRLASQFKKKFSQIATALDPKKSTQWLPAIRSLPELPQRSLHPMTATLSQVEGAIKGGIVGDALAAPFENQSPEQIAVKNPDFSDFTAKGNWYQGKWTDDSLFELATLDSILEDEAIIPRRMARRFSEMGVHRKQRGFGLATKRAVRRLEKGMDWKDAGHEGASSNGAMMRVASTAVFSYRDLEALKKNVLLSSQITHAGEESIAGALGGAYILAKILRGEFKAQTILQETRKFIGPTRFASKLLQVEALLKDPSISPQEAIQKLGTNSRVWESGAAAIYAFLAYLGDYKETIIALTLAGGDTDTMGKIAGMLAGAYVGIEGIPGKWLKGVEQSEKISERAERLYYLLHAKK